MTPSQLSTSGAAALPKLTTYSYTWNEAGDYRIEESIDTFALTGSNGQSPNMNHAQLQKWKQKISVAGPVVQAEKAFGTGSYTVDRIVNLDKLGREQSSTTNLRTTTSTFDDSQTGTGVSLGVSQTGEANIANAFDSAGNRVQMIKDEERTRTAFDALTRVISQFIISVNSVSDSTIRTYKGKETSSIDESMATTIRTNNASTGIFTQQSSKPYTPEHSISMNTDLLGRVESRTESGMGTSTYIHDIYSNLLSETDANGRTQSWIRDAFDRVISHTNFAGQTTTWTYDAWGNILSETDPNSLSTSYAYDLRNRVVIVTDADGGVTTTVYDVQGRKISLTTPNGQTTSWTYDAYDRVLTETNALTQTKTFAYDSADRKTLVIKPDGNKIQYTYGNGQNATKEEWLVGADVVQTLNFQYAAVGKLTSASDSATSLQFTYTDGLLSRETQTLAPGIIAQSDYVYAGGQVREVSIGLGASATFDSKVAFTYTANGQVATLQQTGPTTDTKSARYSYDQAGNRIRTERFSDLGFTIPVFETLSSYTNAQSQLKSTVQSIKHQRATGTILSSYDFVWDAGNRLSSMTSLADGITSYSYTPTNQLSSIDYASIPDQSFTYDLNGNRTGSGNVTGADNRLSSNATWDFLYDANGNMTRRTLKSNNSYIEYVYDHRDRLTEVRYKTSAGTQTKRVLYGYDALNRRYQQTVEGGPNAGTVYYVNQGFRKDRGDAGDEVVLRLDGTGAVISRYLHGSLVDEVLAEENIGSGGVRDVLWPMTDHQGSVRDLARVTSGSASVVNHIVYDAFGKTVSETDAAIAHLYGYTGRELDKETGLQYTRSRYLDLVLARWISQDPKSFAAGDTNLYRYVGNHPSYATDPSGLEIVLPSDEVQKFMDVIKERTGTKIVEAITSRVLEGELVGLSLPKNSGLHDPFPFTFMKFNRNHILFDHSKAETKDALSKEIIVSMLESSRPIQHTSLNNLTLEVAIREEIVSYAIRQKVDFGPPAWNKNLWELGADESHYIRNGISPADALHHTLLDPNSLLGCQTTIKMTVIAGTALGNRRAMGKSEYNLVDPSIRQPHSLGEDARWTVDIRADSGAQPIYGNGQYYDSPADISAGDFIPGDWVYFANFNPREGVGDEGHNAIYVGWGFEALYGKVLPLDRITSKLTKWSGNVGVPSPEIFKGR